MRLPNQRRCPHFSHSLQLQLLVTLLLLVGIWSANIHDERTQRLGERSYIATMNTARLLQKDLDTQAENIENNNDNQNYYDINKPKQAENIENNNDNQNYYDINKPKQAENIENNNDNQNYYDMIKPKHKTKKESTPKGHKETNALVKQDPNSEKESFSHPSTFLQLILALCILVSSIGIHYWKMKRSKRSSRRKDAAGGDYAPIATSGGETEMTPVESNREDEDDEVDAEYGEEDDSDGLPGF